MRAVVAVLLFVTAAHAALWGVLREKQSAPDFRGILPSVSYAPFDGNGHPDVDNIPTVEKIRADMKVLAPLTRAVRLYSSTGGVELVPPLANEVGIKVTVGAWIDKHTDRNEREMQAAVELAKHNSNVNGIVVGNETIYRADQKVDDLIKLIQRVKSQVNVPVTTGEIWNIWLEHPELASSVDFIAAHILPYWEGFSDKQAVDQALIIYQKLRDAFPGKRIVIAEFGWPSAGYNLKGAVPGPFEQAVTLRNFVTRAESIGMEYNIVEAIDQPWKFFEGGVGPYWGILNANREPKFSWTGPVVDPAYWKLAGIALLVGILLSLPILRLFRPTVMVPIRIVDVDLAKTGQPVADLAMEHQSVAHHFALKCQLRARTETNRHGRIILSRKPARRRMGEVAGNQGLADFRRPRRDCMQAIFTHGALLRIATQQTRNAHKRRWLHARIKKDSSTSGCRSDLIGRRSHGSQNPSPGTR